MNRLKNVFRGKSHRQTFPQLIGEYSDSNSLDEVSDSFHWLLDLESPDHDHDKCPYNSMDEEIVKKRRNFAITRSRSFAHPVGMGPKKPERQRKKSSVAFVENQENPLNTKHLYESLDTIIEDHLNSIVRKWDEMDDEVWAKLILLEKNRQTGKAYIKTPVVTIDGSDVGLDGDVVGVNGINNGDGDKESAMCRHLIEEGCRMKLTQSGDILIKRDDNLNIFVKQPRHGHSSSLSDQLIKLPYGLLPQDRTCKLFDMKKFQQNLSTELLKDFPDWISMGNQAVSIFTFAKFSDDILSAPVWVVIVNIVALHILKTMKESGYP